jgi:hypothetical protein
VSCLRQALVPAICVLLEFTVVGPCMATELKQKTVEAFQHYIDLTDARTQAELNAGGHFLWLDTLAESRRQESYDRLQCGEFEIRQQRTQEKSAIEGRIIEVPDGLIHDWVGAMFVPGASLQQAVSLLQDYDNHYRRYKPEVRRSKMLEHSGDTFKTYLQFYRESPRRVSFNVLFQVRYTQIDATHMMSRGSSLRVAELQNPEQPDSPEFPVGQGHGYLWRMTNYWRLQERDGGVYMQVETIALSRDVPVLLGWFVNPLIRRVARQNLAALLSTTRQSLLGTDENKLARRAGCTPTTSEFGVSIPE